MATVNVKTVKKEVMVPKVVTKKVVTFELNEDEATVLCSLVGSIVGVGPERTLADNLYHTMRNAGVGYLRTKIGDRESAVSNISFSGHAKYISYNSSAPDTEWNPVTE